MVAWPRSVDQVIITFTHALSPSPHLQCLQKLAFSDRIDLSSGVALNIKPTRLPPPAPAAPKPLPPQAPPPSQPIRTGPTTTSNNVTPKGTFSKLATLTCQTLSAAQLRYATVSICTSF